MNPEQNNNSLSPKPAATSTGNPINSTPNISGLAGPPVVAANPVQASEPFNGTPNPPNEEPKHSGKWKPLISTLLILTVAPMIALSVTSFALQSYQVDGESMETTLQDHDRLIVDKLPRTWARLTGHNYTPKRADVIIFNQADLPGSLGEDKQLIKRVIGLPGDRVVVKDNAITVYNQAHPTGFNPDTSQDYRLTNSLTTGDTDVILKENQIFVCGDNRPNSEDSRYFGPVQTHKVVGKLVLRLLPINKLEHY